MSSEIEKRIAVFGSWKDAMEGAFNKWGRAADVEHFVEPPKSRDGSLFSAWVCQGEPEIVTAWRRLRSKPALIIVSNDSNTDFIKLRSFDLPIHRVLPTKEALDRVLNTVLSNRRRAQLARSLVYGVLVQVGGVEGTLRVVDVSSFGLAFEMPPTASVENVQVGETLRIERVFQEKTKASIAEKVGLTITNLLVKADGSVRVGGEFVFERSRLERGVRRELDDHFEVSSLIEMSSRMGTFELEDLQGNKFPAKVATDRSQHVWIKECEGLPESSRESLRVWVEAHGQQYTGVMKCLDEKTQCYQLPTRLDHSVNRLTRRYLTDGATKLDFIHPLTNVPVSCPVIDWSTEGALVNVDWMGDPLFPNLIMRNCQLKSHSTSVRCDVKVVHKRPSREHEGTSLVGLKIEGMTEETRAQFAHSLVKKRFPELNDGKQYSFDVLWAFLIDRGIVTEAMQAYWGDRMDQVKATFEKLTALDSDLFREVGFESNGKLAAYVSYVRKTPQIWYVQHLAADPSHQRMGAVLNQCLAEVFFQTPDVSFIQICFSEKSSWTAAIFGEFANRNLGSFKSSLRRFSLHTLELESILQGVPAPTERVVEAISSDVPELQRLFLRVAGPLVCRAEDFFSDVTKPLNVFNKFNAASLPRARQLNIVRDELTGKITGVAVMSFAPAALNIQDFLGGVEILVTPDVDQIKATAVAEALLSAAIQEYRSRGYQRIRFINTLREGIHPLGIEAAEKPYNEWTWHRSLLPAFCQHVDNVFLRMKI